MKTLSPSADFYKKCFYTGIIVYLLMLFLSVFFYKERTIFADMAYHIFYIITGNSFTIQNYRFGAAATQIFPLMALRAGLSLNSIMIIYSFGVVFYYFLCYLISGFVFKNYPIALVILLLNTMFVTHSFYWAQSELPQGLAFLLLFFAFLIQNGKFNIYHLIVCFLASVIAIFFHPIIFIIAIYTVLFLIISKNVTVNKKLLFITTLCFIAVYYFKSSYYVTAYDNQTLKNSQIARDSFFSNFPASMYSYANKHFISNCKHNYYWIVILYVAILFNYLYTRKWILFCFCAISIPGYILFANISFPDGYTRDFYIENIYLPLSIIIGLPFVYHLLPSLNKKHFAVAAIATICLTGCVRIYYRHTMYTDRLNWERNCLNDNPHKKLIIKGNDKLEDSLVITWASPYEFWLLSTTEYHHTACIGIYNDISIPTQWSDRKDIFITPYDGYAYERLNKKYFVFADTNSAYSVIKYK
ncbi:MAG: hypothetical protein ACXVED_19080 [Bacteroidia bacterium]